MASLSNHLERSIRALELSWDRAFDPNINPSGSARDLGAMFASYCDELAIDLPGSRLEQLRTGAFRPARRKGQNVPRLDNGTAAWMFSQGFPDLPEDERGWLQATLLDQMMRRYGATLAQRHDPEVPWIVPFSSSRKTPAVFDDVKAWIADQLRKAAVPADAAQLTQRATRTFLDGEQCKCTRDAIDGPQQRRQRFIELRSLAGTFTLPGTRPIALPFTALDLPASYRTVPVGHRTFDYRVADGGHDEWYRLPPTIYAERHEKLALLAAAMRSNGSMFDNGQALGALRSVERDPAGFVFRFGRITYFDYVMANVLAPLHDGGRPDDLDQTRPERLWSQPRGAFFGLSALVITADRYLILQVRDDRPAADRLTINASVSGGMDHADLAHEHPLEGGLLREGKSEISRILTRAVERGATMTYLGWLRNLHRAFLPELSWVIELEHTTALDWIRSERSAGSDSWRAAARERSEAFECEDGELPALLLIKVDEVLRNARVLLDVGAFPSVDPRRDKAHEPLGDLCSFGWLRKDEGRLRDGFSRGKVSAPLHTTLDCDDEFRPRVSSTLRRLSRRQPALPLLSTLALYVRMLQRTGSVAALPADLRT